MFREKFLVICQLSTTIDEHQVCVSKETAEVIEIAWAVLEAGRFDHLDMQSVLVRPTNTPITDLCCKSIDPDIRSSELTMHSELHRLDLGGCRTLGFARGWDPRPGRIHTV